MKERPILFSGAMVRAILEGRKTQTRRIVKQQLTALSDSSDMFCFDHKGINYRTSSRILTVGAFAQLKQFCPYGQPGDRLWVRETWGIGCRPDPLNGWLEGIEYRADQAYLDEHDLLPLNSNCVPDNVDLSSYKSGWKPSIHMFRWASRITLEILSVRVERLQDISDEDAEAEGIEFIYGEFWRNYCADATRPETDSLENQVDSYESLWESINGSGSWDANPFVWVVEFKQVN